MDEHTKRLTRMWMWAKPIVASFVSSMVRDFSIREDVMQEVVAAVIESFEKYDPEMPFVGWLLGIARNQVGLYYRKMRRDKLVFDEAAVSMLQSSFERVPFSEMQKLEFLQGCIDKLSERDRQLCDMRYEMDMKPAGIATNLGLKANNVSKSLQRIREQLKSCIEFHVAQLSHRV